MPLLLAGVKLRKLQLVLGGLGFRNAHFDLVEFLDLRDHLFLLLSRFLLIPLLLLSFVLLLLFLDLLVLLNQILVDAVFAENVALWADDGFPDSAQTEAAFLKGLLRFSP